MKVIIVGAGLAGLTCGKMLQEAGIEVDVIEKSDGPGGRVRSDMVDGYTLDRGFQVLFTSYPAARRLLNYDNLHIQAFDPGAIVCQGTRRHVLTDPLRDTAPMALLPAMLSNLVPLADKFRTLRLSSELRSQTIQVIADGPDETTAHYLRRKGFSESYLDAFLRPFFGGIFLEKQLTTSARAFRFYWKMLSEGETALPKMGMGEIAKQLSSGLSIQYNTPVKSLLKSPKVGVITESGEEIVGDLVVLATDAWQTVQWLEDKMPVTYTPVGVTTMYFAGDAPLTRSRKIILNANQNAWLSHIAPLTNICPEYAPVGKHLIAASHLGVPETDNPTLYARAQNELRRLFTGDKRALATLETYKPLAIYRISHAQFAQPSGIYANLPSNHTRLPNVYLAGELTGGSSINAAMQSGEETARLIVQKRSRESGI
jgi:phytoene dehydrogenase-like protein